MSDTTEIVQRARQALDARDRPLTNDGHGHVRPRLDGARMRCGGPRLCKVCQAELTVTPNPWDLVRGLLAAVEVALPSVLAQRDDALATIERLRERVGIEVRDREQWEGNAEDRDELRATVDRVQAQTDRWRRWVEVLTAAPGSDRSASVSLRDVVSDLDHALSGTEAD